MIHGQGMGRLPVDVLRRELAARLEDLVVTLSDRPFFFADEMSLADIAVSSQLELGSSGPTPEVNDLLARLPALQAHLERIREACPLES
jgi:glutathione S-transferase